MSQNSVNVLMSVSFLHISPVVADKGLAASFIAKKGDSRPTSS